MTPLTTHLSLTPLRRITIPVDVPQMTYLHTAELRIATPASSSSTPPRAACIAVGEGVAAELILRFSVRWSGAVGDAAQAQMEFCYELEAAPDTWLIGGRRRSVYRARPGQEMRFRILLMPQKAGYLAYPTVDVRIVENGDGPPTTSTSTSPSSDVNFLNHGQFVTVVPNRRSTTTNISMSGGWTTGGHGRVEVPPA